MDKKARTVLLVAVGLLLFAAGALLGPRLEEISNNGAGNKTALTEYWTASLWRRLISHTHST